MKHKHLIIASIVVPVVLAVVGFQSMGRKSVTPELMKEWVSYLASDEMRGRANGSQEMLSAANWISDRYKEFNLKPVLSDGSFIQNYTYTGRQKSVISERNVIGCIEGSDPALRDQYIVITCHFDHIGVRRNNEADSIYNGADDNAAGTCTMLGIARNLMASDSRPARSVVFAAFSGEENGMRGSRHFVANSPVPVAKIYANINFEMTGHSEFLGKNKYYMTGCKISELDDVIKNYNQKSGWTLVDTIKLADQLFYASDNISFSRAVSVAGKNSGVPSGTFATTALADYIHSPRDEAQYFDFENMAGLVNYFTGLIMWLSESPAEINFTSPSFEKIK